MAAADTVAIVAWQSAPDGALKERLLAGLFKAKRGLIQALAQKAAFIDRSTLDADELLQAGYAGFLRALKKFDPTRKLSIATYGWWWIKHEVQYATRGDKLISLPRIRLTNDERSMVLAAIAEDPDLDPETIGIPRTQFEQVKASYGLRFVSEAVPAGALAIERCMAAAAEYVDIEEELDRHRDAKVLFEEIVPMVRRGASPEECGLSDDEYASARDYIRTKDEEERERLMSEAAQASTAAVVTPAKAKRTWTPERRAKEAARAAARRAAEKKGPRKAKRDAATEVFVAAPNKFAVRLAQLEAEKAALEMLAALPADIAARVCAIAAAA